MDRAAASGRVAVTRTGLVTAEPREIVALAVSNSGCQRLNPYLSADPDLRIVPFGPDPGVGSGFRFDGKDGRGEQIAVAVEENAVRYAIDLGPMGQPT